MFRETLIRGRALTVLFSISSGVIVQIDARIREMGIVPLGQTQIFEWERSSNEGG